jgi:hypothetical protein
MQEHKRIEVTSNAKMQSRQESKSDSRIRKQNAKEYNNGRNKNPKLFELMMGYKYSKGKTLPVRTNEIGRESKSGRWNRSHKPNHAGIPVGLTLNGTYSSNSEQRLARIHVPQNRDWSVPF